MKFTVIFALLAIICAAYAGKKGPVESLLGAVSTVGGTLGKMASVLGLK